MRISENDTLVPAYWAGRAGEWLRYHVQRESPQPPVWTRFQVSGVIKDGDLSRAFSDLLDTFLEPLCKELLDKIVARDYRVTDYSHRCPDAYQQDAEIRLDRYVIRVGMGYDTYAAGTRVTVSFVRTS